MAHHKSPVIRSMAASNTWLLGILIALVGVVFVVLYNYSIYKDVKGVSTTSGTLKAKPTQAASHEEQGHPGGCFITKGSVEVYNSCGTGMYRNVQYSCGDNKKITLGSSASCRSVANWMTTIAVYCKGHTSCDDKGSPTPTTSKTSTGKVTPTVTH